MIWEDIEGYKLKYMISDEGDVFSKCLNKNMKLQLDRYGYLYVSLTGGKKHKVHRLVAKAFLKTSEKETVNHIDGNKLNNKVSNLEWATVAENNYHRVNTIGVNFARGEKAGASKLTSEVVKLVRVLFKLGNTNAVISRLLGIKPQHVGKLTRRENWKHLGYI